MTTAVWDYDVIKYNVGAACEKRSIVVTHPSGIEQSFKTRTEFYGHWKEKKGGWLAEYNMGLSDDCKLLPEEFTITDKQELKGPIEHCLSSVKHHIANINEKIGADKYYGFIGRGDSFRVELSTLLKYKGQRSSMLKPLLLPDIEEYLLKYQNCEVVTGFEADDKLVMECHKKPDNILVCVDKDFDGVNNLTIYNSNREELYKTGSGMGKLWKNDKGKVMGIGRKFLCFQILSGDSSDNYCANCFSDVKWADNSAYNILVDCTSDKECFQALIDCYKNLYPTSKVVTGWRGNEIEIDWRYVLEENWNMARMWRTPTDELSLASVMKKIGVKYE